MLQSQPICSFSSRLLIAASSSGLVWLEKVMNNTGLASETHVRISTSFFSDTRFELSLGFLGVFKIDFLRNELAKAFSEAAAFFKDAVFSKTSYCSIVCCITLTLDGCTLLPSSGRLASLGLVKINI